jgi:predicted nucleic acid-binding protein
VIFVLGTNVLSEGAEPTPDPKVLDFLRRLPLEKHAPSAIVLGEIAQGVENHPTPRLKTFLAEVLALPLAEFGEAEALEWGRLTSRALKAGLSVRVRDSQIAATAAVRDWTVATRDTQDFTPFGVRVFNPWVDKL